MLNIKQNLQPEVSPTIALNQKVKELQARGESVTNMSIGENRFPPPNQLIESLKKYTDKVTYSDPLGVLELRTAVSKLYEKTDSDSIVISPGSKAGIFILLMALDGDLLLVRPSWVSYIPQAKHTGKQITWIETSFENSYVPSPKAIEQAYDKAKKSGQNPKLIILNYPNNPTSTMPTYDQMKEITTVCKELGLTIISDELYLNLTYHKKDAVSPVKFYPEGVIRVGGVSKFLSIAGLRIGWIVIPKSEIGERLTAILKAIASDIWSNVATSIQFGIAEYLEYGNLFEYLAVNKLFHQHRNKIIYKGLKEMGIEVVEPRGGFYIYLNLENFRKELNKIGIINGLDLQNYLIKEYKIACLSGSSFGADKIDMSLRMSTSFLDCNDTQQAQKLFDNFRNSVSKRSFINKENHPELFLFLEKMKDFSLSLTR